MVRPRRARLKHAGIHLISILKLDVMMNLYRSSGLLDEEQHERYLAYVRATRPATPDHNPTYVETPLSDDDA